MGIKPVELNDNIWRRMDQADRKKYPRKLRLTQAEREREQLATLERKIHDQFSSFCRRNGIDFWHSSPVRKSSIEAGLPDFLCAKNNRHVCIEFKVAPNKLSAVQEQRIALLALHGNDVYVCTETQEGSAYKEATELVTEFFNLNAEGAWTD
jgi:hypothetical protein